MTYYEIVDDKIGRYTDNEHIAELNGLTLTTNDEIVFGADGERYLASQCPSAPHTDAKRCKRQQINAGFDAALAASLTMPSINTPPSTAELAVGAATFAAEDAEGLAYIMQTHSARRDALLSAVDSATSVEAVQSITVSYAV